MTQSIVIQVGQCGNQIGYRFWDLAIRELEMNKFTQQEVSDAFFRISEYSSVSCERYADNIKARALLVDMEEGVIAEMLKGPLKALFESKQMVTDVSGSGNNWAVGYHLYGNMYEQQIEDLIRKEAEMCDSLQCFFLLHSMGGGTGSGLGTRILEILSHVYPKKHKFVTSVYPSPCDDVVVSPYNALLANNELIEYADCVFPVENKTLANICEYNYKKTLMTESYKSSAGVSYCSYEKPFDNMNNIVANLLLNVTCSSRFPGTLNVDLNELVMNMIPFPRLHFLASSLTPLFPIFQSASTIRANNIFTDLFSNRHHLFEGELKKGTFLACALLVRGEVNFSDVQQNIDRLRHGLKFVSWNEDGWKTGLCNVQPLEHPYSAILLANNSCIWQSFSSLKSRFLKMYAKRAHLHHFLRVDGFEEINFDASLSNLDCLIEEYKTISGLKDTGLETPRMKILV